MSSYLLSYVGQHTINRLRNELYQHIQKQDMGFFDKNRTGDLMSRITGDVSILQQLVSSGMLQMITELFTFLAIAFYMLYVNPLLMLCTFSLLFLFTRKVGKRMRSSFRSVQASLAATRISAIVAYLAYLRLLQTPVRQLSRMINLIQQSAAAYDRISEILNTKPSITEKENAFALPPLRGQVEFEHVTFGYQAGIPVLGNFDLRMAPGTVTALVGSSGAGKSTVAHEKTATQQVTVFSCTISQ
ncbi:ABC transporter transmembrane domain-containing protein [Brevibacillus sp. NRS-1366]|uniref:ABC transporter transmembrane domain-containing protein n=1 Tax=Brevibacillus sp. NRS-1366 TaxID=3233899 RepID=UPI003D25155E